MQNIPIKSTVCREATRKTDTDLCTVYPRPRGNICQQSSQTIAQIQAVNVNTVTEIFRDVDKTIMMIYKYILIIGGDTLHKRI